MEQIEIPFYYNTNKLRDPELQKQIDRCKKQEKDVYNFFLNNLGTGFCWSECQDKIGVEIKMCSIKRCLTNLKKKKFLLKTDDMVMSRDGGKSHRYIFNTELLE
mgnify:CR=1 FL=1